MSNLTLHLDGQDVPVNWPLDRAPTDDEVDDIARAWRASRGAVKAPAPITSDLISGLGSAGVNMGGGNELPHLRKSLVYSDPTQLTVASESVYGKRAHAAQNLLKTNPDTITPDPGNFGPYYARQAGEQVDFPSQSYPWLSPKIASGGISDAATTLEKFANPQIPITDAIAAKLGVQKPGYLKTAEGIQQDATAMADPLRLADFAVDVTSHPDIVADQLVTQINNIWSTDPNVGVRERAGGLLALVGIALAAKHGPIGSAATGIVHEVPYVKTWLTDGVNAARAQRVIQAALNANIEPGALAAAYKNDPVVIQAIQDTLQGKPFEAKVSNQAGPGANLDTRTPPQEGPAGGQLVWDRQAKTYKLGEVPTEAPQVNPLDSHIADNWRTRTQGLLNAVQTQMDNVKGAGAKLGPLKRTLTESLDTNTPHSSVIQELTDSYNQANGTDLKPTAFGMDAPVETPPAETQQTPTPEAAGQRFQPLDVPQETPKPPPVKETPKPTPQPEKTQVETLADTTSARNESTAADRAAMGLEDLPDAERKTFEQSLNEAQKKGANSKALATAQAVLKKPRPMTDVETAGAALRMAELKNLHESTLQQIDQAITNGDLGAAHAAKETLTGIESEFDQISQAVKRSGTETGRSLASRKLTLNNTYDQLSVKQRARAANPDRPLSTGESKRLDDLTKALKKAQADIEGHQNTIAELKAKQAADEIARTARRTARATTKAELATERKSLLEQLGKEVQKVTVGAGSGFGAIQGILEGDSGKIIRKLVVNVAKDVALTGQATLEAVVSAVHAHLKPMGVELTDRQIHDVLSSYGNETKPMGETQRTVSQMKAVARNSSLAEDVVAGGERPVRKTPVTSPQIENLQKKSALLKAQIDTEIANRRKLTFGEKVLRLQHWGIFSGPGIAGKLGGATAAHIPVEFVADLIEKPLGELLSNKGTKFKDVPLTRAGTTLTAELKGAMEFVNKATYTDALQKITKGKNSLDAEAIERGQAKAGRNSPFWDFWSNVHGAMKTPLQRSVFSKSMEIRLKMAAERGLDVNNPTVKTAIAERAYNDSLEAILRNDNKLAGVVNSLFDGLEHKTGKSIGGIARTAVPVTKVASNYVGRSLQYTGGGVIEGLARQIHAKVTGATLDAAQTETIMKAYKRGGVGAGIAALVLLNPGDIIQAGGYYAPGKKQQGALKPGDLIIAGVHIPHALAHNPVFESIQFWSTIKRGFQSGGAGMAAYDVSFGLGEQEPGIGQVMQFGKGIQSETGTGDFFGQWIRGIAEPQAVQQTTAYLDKDAAGNPINRKPKGFTDQLKMGLPGLRQQVPVKSSTR